MEWVGAIRTRSPEGEERYAPRHSLSLDARASAGGNAARVLVLNLSSTGLLIDSALELALDEEIDVELPQAGTQRARVVWRSERYYGCQFAEPVSEATVSAARLRSALPERRQAPVFPHTVAGEAAEPDADAPPTTGLTVRQKVLVIVGLASACWAAIILAAAIIL